MLRSTFLKTGLLAAGLCIASAASPDVVAAPPKATALFPAGGGRGQTVEVTVSGTFDTWPAQVWSNEPGLKIEPASDKGKLSISIEAEAAPGLRWIRLFDAEGAIVPLGFEVDAVPSVVETERGDGPPGERRRRGSPPEPGAARPERNDSPATAQPIESLPVVIDGRFVGRRGDVDGYAVKLSKGQTLVASLKGRRLGSPMDAVLQVVSPAGFVVRQSDDDVALDPLIAYEVPEEGTYIVRGFAFPSEPNSTIGFASGDQFQYRLTLTTDAFIDHTLPLALTTGVSDASIEPFGWNLPAESTPLPIERIVLSDRVRVWHPAAASTAELPFVSLPGVVEVPSSETSEPQTIEPPVMVSGRIEKAGERDRYAFAAKKDEEVHVRVVARELTSRLDPQLRITDEKGQVVAEQDDNGRDSRDVDLRFKPPADGRYVAIVSDLNAQGGVRSFYRLEVARPRPDFQLTVGADQFTVEPGKSVTIDVAVRAEEGFDEVVELVVEGLPEGVTATFEAGEAPKEESGERRRGRRRQQPSAPIKLTLTAKEDVAPFSGPVTILGRATLAETPAERIATFASTHPGRSIAEVWLTVPARAEAK